MCLSSWVCAYGCQRLGSEEDIQLHWLIHCPILIVFNYTYLFICWLIVYVCLLLCTHIWRRGQVLVVSSFIQPCGFRLGNKHLYLLSYFMGHIHICVRTHIHTYIWDRVSLSHYVAALAELTWSLLWRPSWPQSQRSPASHRVPCVFNILFF